MAKASCVMTSDEEGITGSLMLSQVTEKCRHLTRFGAAFARRPRKHIANRWLGDTNQGRLTWNEPHVQCCKPVITLSSLTAVAGRKAKRTLEMLLLYPPENVYGLAASRLKSVRCARSGWTARRSFDTWTSPWPVLGVILSSLFVAVPHARALKSI